MNFDSRRIFVQKTSAENSVEFELLALHGRILSVAATMAGPSKFSFLDHFMLPPNISYSIRLVENVSDSCVFALQEGNSSQLPSSGYSG